MYYRRIPYDLVMKMYVVILITSQMISICVESLAINLEIKGYNLICKFIYLIVVVVVVVV
jgi:hypothetical protein